MINDSVMKIAQMALAAVPAKAKPTNANGKITIAGPQFLSANPTPISEKIDDYYLQEPVYAFTFTADQIAQYKNSPKWEKRLDGLVSTREETVKNKLVKGETNIIYASNMTAQEFNFYNLYPYAREYGEAEPDDPKIMVENYHPDVFDGYVRLMGLENPDGEIYKGNCVGKPDKYLVKPGRLRKIIPIDPKEKAANKDQPRITRQVGFDICNARHERDMESVAKLGIMLYREPNAKTLEQSNNHPVSEDYYAIMSQKDDPIVAYVTGKLDKKKELLKTLGTHSPNYDLTDNEFLIVQAFEDLYKYQNKEQDLLQLLDLMNEDLVMKREFLKTLGTHNPKFDLTEDEFNAFEVYNNRTNFLFDKNGLLKLSEEEIKRLTDEANWMKDMLVRHYIMAGNNLEHSLSKGAVRAICQGSTESVPSCFSSYFKCNGMWGKFYDTTTFFHRGIDISFWEGAPIYSICNGMVVNRLNSTLTYLTIEAVYPEHVYITYMHANFNSSLVVGTYVEMGQQIGTESNHMLGSNPQYHTHVEINETTKDNEPGQYYHYDTPQTTQEDIQSSNPYPFIDAWYEIFHRALKLKSEQLNFD